MKKRKACQPVQRQPAIDLGPGFPKRPQQEGCWFATIVTGEQYVIPKSAHEKDRAYRKALEDYATALEGIIAKDRDKAALAVIQKRNPELLRVAREESA